VPVGRMMFSRPELLLRLMLWTELMGSYSELLDFTADSVLSAYRDGAKRWLSSDSPAGDAIQETALRLLTQARRNGGWFTASEAANWVGNRSEQTVLRHLNELVRRGIFESLGRTRGKRYRVISRHRMLPEIARRLGGGLEESVSATQQDLWQDPGQRRAGPTDWN
ncbi:MAG: hypothetical protein L3J96_05655, partial [Thermoplasmata archaeon]|nr:hypothetical protein [Thermoplasmata archaeon]